MLINKKSGIAIGLLLVATLGRAASYTAQEVTVDGADVVRLTDTTRGVVVSILPGSGNRAYELTVHGKQVLARPGAEAVAQLEFWRHPDWMAQFPFAHTLTMTHRLHGGVLDVETKIENLSDDSMPVSIGYHPWFQLSDVPRDEWKLDLAARDHLDLSGTKIPTGKSEATPFADPLPLKGLHLDDVFGGLIRDARGEASFSIEGGPEKVTVTFGPKYQNAVVYAPPGRDIVCLEPMSGPTNAFNMAHEGTYSALQSISPRGEWHETFSIKAEGF